MFIIWACDRAAALPAFRRSLCKLLLNLCDVPDFFFAVVFRAVLFVNIINVVDFVFAVNRSGASVAGNDRCDSGFLKLTLAVTAIVNIEESSVIVADIKGAVTVPPSGVIIPYDILYNVFKCFFSAFPDFKFGSQIKNALKGVGVDAE